MRSRSVVIALSWMSALAALIITIYGVGAYAGVPGAEAALWGTVPGVGMLGWVWLPDPAKKVISLLVYHSLPAYIWRSLRR